MNYSFNVANTTAKSDTSLMMHLFAPSHQSCIYVLHTPTVNLKAFSFLYAEVTFGPLSKFHGSYRFISMNTENSTWTVVLYIRNTYFAEQSKIKERNECKSFQIHISFVHSHRQNISNVTLLPMDASRLSTANTHTGSPARNNQSPHEQSFSGCYECCPSQALMTLNYNQSISACLLNINYILTIHEL